MFVDVDFEAMIVITINIRTKQDHYKHIYVKRNILCLQEAPSGFNWDETIQNQILGAFFWFHWVTQIPGGILARKYGTKAIFGLSNFTCCVLNLLIPICAYIDYKLLVANRVIQGLVVVSIALQTVAGSFLCKHSHTRV